MTQQFCDFYIFGLVDGLGDTIQAPVEDPSETICIDGYMPEDHPKHPGEKFYFESDAYHLKQWAEENGMVAFKHGYMYNQLPKPHVVYE